MSECQLERTEQAGAGKASARDKGARARLVRDTVAEVATWQGRGARSDESWKNGEQLCGETESGTGSGREEPPQETSQETRSQVRHLNAVHGEWTGWRDA